MGKFIYLYGIIKSPLDGADPFSSMKGIDDEHEVHLKEFGELSAVVCHVDESEYGEEVLEEKTNQMEWVQKKAFHHHEMLMKLNEEKTIIPMKFCTIYQSENSLAKMIDDYKSQMLTLIEQLDGKEEWNLKIYCDREKLTKLVADHNLNIKEKKEEIAQMSKGRQYLETRKLDQYIEQEAEKEEAQFGSDLHGQLIEWSIQDTVKKNWKRDVTGREEDMCWNSAYLVPLKDVENFLGLISEASEKHKDSGYILEVTGPWPAYHFVNLLQSEE
ncbi:GvpL/GvpF family gas vesicle protein [Halobacillus sp. Marseille-Q1614]|uniref:GvpL/GvpF family gas vesicle protein n=1 Tax=Halobacillus sp. Marseille-Q1614 TaxID=2709134 RepID=UPI00156E930A|nr:GvpL/GvpF family gas vesicle protein [Halobacillus sp. Marseille-Q1614]